MVEQAAAHRGEPVRHPPTWIGWAARIFSLGAIGVLVALLVIELMRPARDVTLDVRPAWQEVRRGDGSVMVPVDVTNMGTGPAQDLLFELDGGVGEPVELEAALIGGGETIRYVVAFPERPEAISHRVLRYEAP